MRETKEIYALLHLIDDPDEEVFSTVSERIVSYGKGIIPNLENLWENTPDEATQERIELLIHSLHFRDLKAGVTEWAAQESPELLQGALLIDRYQYPEVSFSGITQELERMRRNIWLELNNYLTPLEQVNIINGILYNYYKLKGTEVAYANPDEFFLHKVIETKRGNAISTGILYAALCQLLDINVLPVNIPRQFILGYFDPNYDVLHATSNPAHKIQFFLDPMSGQVFTHKDVETYFKRISVPPIPTYYKPLSPKRTIQLLTEELSKCFGAQPYKQNELAQLALLLND
jgi:regulator of sirC expression with transglutaminase-like and TPR domain